jgi:Domain of unknown function (DUF4157)
MQDPASGLPRIVLLRCWVNKRRGLHLRCRFIRGSSPSAKVGSLTHPVVGRHTVNERTQAKPAEKSSSFVPTHSRLLQRKCACGGTPGVDGLCAECRTRQLSGLQRSPQRSPGGHTGLSEAPPIVHEVLASAGQPLDAPTRAFMEPRFGHNFSQVRVHADSKAIESAHAVNALAYTVGNHVVFGGGKYQPQSGEGRELLAHELAHTVQQEQVGISPGAKLEIGKVADTYERQSDSAAAGIIHGSNSPVLGAAPLELGGIQGLRLQRKPPRPATAIELPDPRSDIFSVAEARLVEIIHTGGPIPTDQTRVIGAAIIDVEGYTGPKEIRAISGAATDPLGGDSPVTHATSPDERTLSATRSISGSGLRREFPFSHINDAEIKLFEEISRHLPPNAKGTIHFSTIRARQVAGGTILEPYPACSGCTRATFEMSTFQGVNMVSYAPSHPAGSIDLGSVLGPTPGLKGASQSKTTPLAPLKPAARTVSGEFGEITVPPPKGTPTPPTTPTGPEPVAEGPGPTVRPSLGSRALQHLTNPALMGPLTVLSWMAEEREKGYVDFGPYAEPGGAPGESTHIVLGKQGLGEQVHTTTVKTYPRDELKTLTFEEAERTLKEGEHFLYIRTVNLLHGQPEWVQRQFSGLKQFSGTKKMYELWKISGGTASPTHCTSDDGTNFSCSPEGPWV